MVAAALQVGAVTATVGVTVKTSVFKLFVKLAIVPELPLVAPLAGNSVTAVDVVIPFRPPITVLEDASVVALIVTTPPPPPPPGPSLSLLVIN